MGELIDTHAAEGMGQIVDDVTGVGVLRHHDDPAREAQPKGDGEDRRHRRDLRLFSLVLLQRFLLPFQQVLLLRFVV